MPIAARRRVLHVHPQRADVLVERLDGEPPQFILRCARHQLLSLPVDRMDLVPECPECEAEANAAPWRLRYAALHHEHAFGRLSIEGWR